MTLGPDQGMYQLSLAAKASDILKCFYYEFFLCELFLDLQNVNITLRVLFRPVPTSLPNIYSTLGIDYDERVLPSITNEILKAVVVR
jgi:hypothetical protein